MINITKLVLFSNPGIILSAIQTNNKQTKRECATCTRNYEYESSFWHIPLNECLFFQRCTLNTTFKLLHIHTCLITPDSIYHFVIYISNKQSLENALEIQRKSHCLFCWNSTSGHSTCWQREFICHSGENERKLNINEFERWAEKEQGFFYNCMFFSIVLCYIVCVASTFFY